MKLKVFLALATGMMFGIAFAAISIDPIARTFTKIGGAGMVLISGSGIWTASTETDWILIKPRTSADAGVSCVYAVSKNMSINFK